MSLLCIYTGHSPMSTGFPSFFGFCRKSTVSGEISRKTKRKGPICVFPYRQAIRQRFVRLGAWDLGFVWDLVFGIWSFSLRLVLALLAAFGAADAVHQVNKWEKHGDDDAADHDGEEDD